jgi:hypothetical protein
MTGLSAVAQNTALLDLLRGQGVPQAGGSYCYDGWVPHTHPDLIDRLEGLAPDWPILPTYGVPVIAAKGIAGAAALSTSTLLLRLPEAPPEDLEVSWPWEPLTDPGQEWYSVDAWQTGLRSPEGTRRLSLLVMHALTHAASLATADGTDWRGHPVQAPAERGGRGPVRRRGTGRDRGSRQGGRGRRR